MAHRGIDLRANDALAHRVAQALAAAEANVVGDQLAATAVAVVDVHTVAAQPTERAALQEGATFPGWALRSLPAQGLCAFLQTLLDALVVLPGNISRVGIFDQRMPLTFGQALVSRAPIGLLSPAAPAVDVGAGVPGVMQGVGGAAQ